MTICSFFFHLRSKELLLNLKLTLNCSINIQVSVKKYSMTYLASIKIYFIMKRQNVPISTLISHMCSVFKNLNSSTVTCLRLLEIGDLLFILRQDWCNIITIQIQQGWLMVHSDSPIKGLKRAKRLSALTPGGPQIYDPDLRRTV